MTETPKKVYIHEEVWEEMEAMVDDGTTFQQARNTWRLKKIMETMGLDHESDKRPFSSSEEFDKALEVAVAYVDAWERDGKDSVVIPHEERLQ